MSGVWIVVLAVTAFCVGEWHGGWRKRRRVLGRVVRVVPPIDQWATRDELRRRAVRPMATQREDVDEETRSRGEPPRERMRT